MEEVSYWRRWAAFFFILSGALGILSFYLGSSLVFTRMSARQDLLTHTNLYYRMWKSGDRRFESCIAFPGLVHDREYREELIGTSRRDFERIFPNAFHELRNLPPRATHSQTWLVNDYAASLDIRKGRASWIAVFQNDRLVELIMLK